MDSVARSRVVANGIRKSSTEVLIPFATLYLASIYGASMTGMIMFFILGAGLFSNLFSAHFLSCFQLRKIIVFSEVAHMATLVAMCFSVTLGEHETFVLLYMLKSVLFSLSIPASEAVLGLFSKGKRRRVYTLDFWTLSVVAPFFSVIGAFVYPVSFNYVIYVAIFLSFIYTVLSFRYIPDHVFLEKKGGGESGLIYFKRLDFYQFMIVWLACVLVMSVMFLFNTYFAIDIATHSYSFFGWRHFSGVTFFGVLKYISALSPVWMLFFYGKRLDFIQGKADLRYVYTLLLLLYMVVYSGILSDSWIVVSLLVFVICTIEMIIEPVRKAMIIELIDEKEHASVYYALTSLIGRVGNIVASLILAFSFNRASFMTLTGVVIMMGMGLLWIGIKVNQQGIDKGRLEKLPGKTGR